MACHSTINYAILDKKMNLDLKYVSQMCHSTLVSVHTAGIFSVIRCR